MRTAVLLALVAGPLSAAAIDSSGKTATLHSGDALAFQILTSNFGVHAAHYGLSPYPTDVDFIFVTAPLADAGSMSAVLESGDGAVSVAFGGPYFFAPGLYSSGPYSGAVSILEGHLHLDDAQSAAIFGSGTATLVLTDEGGDLELGLAPNPLRRDLFVSLSSGELSVGAISGTVAAETAVPEPAAAPVAAISLVLTAFLARLKNQPFAKR